MIPRAMYTYTHHVHKCIFTHVAPEVKECVLGRETYTYSFYLLRQ